MAAGTATTITRRVGESLLAFVGWWLAAWLVSLAYPAVADYLPISLIWVANALAYGAVLSLGPRLIPAFTLAALTWNIARGDALPEIVIGTGAFLVVMLFVIGFSRLLENRVDQDQARRLLRVPIIAITSASVFTLLGVWQFAGGGLPATELVIALWLSEATSVLLFTPLVQQVVTASTRHHGPPRFRPITGVIAAWTLTAFLVLAALLLVGRQDGTGREWLPYLALTVPMLAVYLLPTSVTRFAVAGFVLVWVGVHYVVFTRPDGMVEVNALLNGQMIIFTATLIAFLAIESVLSFELANHRLKAARLRDGVTDLYNDLGLTRRLRELAAPGQPHRRLALIGAQIPDVDDLSALIGLDEVHRVERLIGETLREVRPSPEIAAGHLQPGLFAMLVPERGEADRATMIATHLRAAIDRAEREGQLPTARQGVRLAVLDTVTAGDHQHLTTVLLMACQKDAERDDRPFHHHREPAIHLIEDHRRTLEWARNLREALAGETAAGGFALFAQPIVDRHDPGAHRIEVLLRWRTPDGRIEPPGTFLEIAEHFGLMPKIDRWVLDHALAAVDSQTAGIHLTEIAINLSGDSLAGGWLPSRIETLLEDHHWPAERLCLEITETMLIRDTARAQRNLAALHELGVAIAIDDFGTGRATFSYLQHYPVDELKIDGSFVRRLAESSFDREVVKTTRVLADHLGCRVVAEFVETPRQVELLEELGVHFHQGYGVAEPMPLDDYLAGLPSD
ncbi:EAL domain-containing protein [Guyparkeria sp. SB14A]|uniref:EAL domain-containing protein n=1 Tax=Guyparkeria sp. SB14A TaxID=2571147 RepID=UPI0010AB6EA1|nr:EAL domain-containing protein [Guyparkeria sp. SB14A]TKA89069.1 EAL domain-containing protein [Guyparkeria sp. SB14A]